MTNETAAELSHSDVRAPWLFQPTQHRSIARALPSGVIWTYAAGIAGALLVVIVGILAALVSTGMWFFNRDVSVLDNIRTVSNGALWVLVPVVLVAGIGAAVYAATTRKSLMRSAIGVAAAGATGALMFFFLETPGWVVATLAVGWAVGMPADRPGRIALRAIPPYLGAAALILRLPKLGQLTGLQLAAVVLLSPLVAALLVWLMDALWVGGTRRSQPKEEPEQ
jgi:hypothetical protein